MIFKVQYAIFPGTQEGVILRALNEKTSVEKKTQRHILNWSKDHICRLVPSDFLKKLHTDIKKLYIYVCVYIHISISLFILVC